jgi:8-oxo-dGTP pyrophosphatase MutT (NUDIX family)
MVTLLRDHELVVPGRRLRLRLALTDELPPTSHVSAAHCVGFDEDLRVLLARHVEREWTIPGGHLEPGESPAEAMRRECMEEAAAVVDAEVLVASERVDLLEGDPDPRYPQPAYQVFYVAHVVDLGTLVPNLECVESRLFPIPEARSLPGWMDHNQDLFEAALVVAQSRL